MTTSTYIIAFDFQLEDSKVIIPLTAKVEEHHSETYYIVKDITAGTGRKGPVLPDITIKKKNGWWVHSDSEKASLLSTQVGKSIDAYRSDRATPERP